MDIRKLPLMQEISNKAAWLQRAYEVHTNNLARVDMPGAQAYTLKARPQDKKDTHFPAFALTHPRHMSLSGNSKISKTRARTGEVTASGKTIQSEDEMRTLNELSLKYRQGTEIYKKARQMLNMVVTK